MSDFVDVIRCKNCKYFHDGMCSKYPCWSFSDAPVSPNGFCYQAKKVETEEDEYGAY